MTTTEQHYTDIETKMLGDAGEARVRFVCTTCGETGNWYYTQEFDGDVSLAYEDAQAAALNEGDIHASTGL